MPDGFILISLTTWDGPKPMADDTCEMRNGAKWVVVSIDEALGRPREVKRCSACHGRVKAFRAYRTGTRAHFEHFVLHRGCPTKPTFDGQATQHPLALG